MVDSVSLEVVVDDDASSDAVSISSGIAPAISAGCYSTASLKSVSSLFYCAHIQRYR